MAQRLALVRALCVEPGILLMDEPFSGLDEITAQRLRLDLLSIWRETRKTIVFVTHNAYEACFLADRILVMSGGAFRQEICVPIARPRSYEDPSIFELSRDVIRAFGEEIDREPAPVIPATSAARLIDSFDAASPDEPRPRERLRGTTMLSRSTILVTAILAACVPASAQVKVRIGDLAQSLNEIGSRVMIDQGIDRKYGIAAEYRAYPTLDGLFTAIRGKDVDVGFAGWTAIAQFRSKGFPVTMIFPVGRGVTVDVIVPAASPISSIAELKGKKVGSVRGAAGTATVLFRVIASKFHGFDPAKTSDLQFAGPGLLPPCSTKGSSMQP